MVAQVDKELFRISKRKSASRLLSWALFEGRPLTTKGRFINPLVFAWYRLSQYIPLKTGTRAPIYIVGTGRSGTTVLGKLLCVHRDVMFLNEPKAIWHYAIRNEDLIGSYTDAPTQVRLDTNQATPEAMSKINRVYNAALRLSGARQIIDKYPELIFRTEFVNRLFPDAKFIVIIRDGVDACKSVTQWSNRHKVIAHDGIEDWWGKNDRKWNLLVSQLVEEHQDLVMFKEKLVNTKNHEDRAAVEWILAMREAKKALRNRSKVLSISYEALCKDSEKTIKELLRFCSLQSDSSVIKYSSEVLHDSPLHGQLQLLPELVEPFNHTLIEMGYQDSVERVTHRKHIGF